MPTYEYQCGACRHEWEAEQSIKEEALKDCPKCSKATAKRQISAGTGFIFKGGSGTGTAAPPPAMGKPTPDAFQERFEKISGMKLGGDKE